MKRVIIFILFATSTLLVSAQQLGKIRDVRQRIDSIHYMMQDYRDSMRVELKAYRDSLREERRHAYDGTPHNLRIGWGDQMFESLIWYDNGYYEHLPDEFEDNYNENYRYLQHYFIEYMYNLNYWYSFGMLVDYSGVIWDQVTRNGAGKELSRESNRSFHNIAMIPTVRFSYFHHDYVSLYSSLGFGLNVNTGTELDMKGRKTAVSPALNVTLLGVRVGKGHFYGALEVGAMAALNSKDEVYMLGSRIFTASVGVRF